MLRSVQSGSDEGYMSLINLTEFYYILYRKDHKIAEEKLKNLLSFGLKPVNVEDTWKKSAKIKADFGIPLADCFAAATALALEATLVVGEDSDFKGLKIKTIKI